MKLNKFLIAIVYYERPKVLINALKSILDIAYPEFEVHLIDDGSTNRAEPIVREVCSSIIDKFKFSYIENTIEQKKEQGGSLHGRYLTDAIKESDADHVIVLCDDDAIYPHFLTKLNLLINKPENKDKNYFYHNIVLYDCLREPYTNGVERGDLSYFTNQWKEPINCDCRVDGSQVTYNRKRFVEDNIIYPYPQTSMLDSVSFKQMFNAWGPAYYSGLISQVKSNNEDNLIFKYNTDKIFITNDMK
jgi:glycosyltransferase involved in cell wall biosynthesis